MFAITLQEALVNFEKAAAEYQKRGKEDLDRWTRWGYALIEVRDAYKHENKRPCPRKQMVEYCKTFQVDASTGYRWVDIATYEPRIRKRLTEQGRESADQNEMLKWVKEWKPRSMKGRNGENKGASQPPCPLCDRKMGKELAKKVATRLPSVNGQTVASAQGPPVKDDSLLRSLAQVRDALEIGYQDKDKIDWPKEDLPACKEMILEILSACDQWTNEFDNHDLRSAT